MALILFGGTFDPIHNGHMSIANQAYQLLKPSQLVFIPCFLPVHKAKSEASATDRLCMLEYAIQENQSPFVIDTYELEHKIPNYTIHTLRHYKARYPKETLFWLMGADSFLNFQSWHAWESILDLSHLIVMQRTDSILTAKLKSQYDIHTDYHESIFHQLNGKVLLINQNKIDISSSELRECFAKQKPASSFLAKSVLNYIEKKRLYQSEA